MSLHKALWRAALLASLGGAVTGAGLAFVTSIGTGYEVWLTSGGALTGLTTGVTAFGTGLGVAVTAKRAPRSVRSGLAVLAATLAGSLVVVGVLSETRSVQVWQWAAVASGLIVVIACVAAIILERVCEQSQTASA